MSMLKAKIASALAKIGTVNGTAPEASQDPFDAVAHEYNVAGTLRSISEKRYDLAKVELVKSLSGGAKLKLGSTVTVVGKSEVSDTIKLIDAQNHSLSAQVKIGASYLDVDALRVELKKTMTTEQVDKLFEKHTKRRNPSVTYIVSETSDG